MHHLADSEMTSAIRLRLLIAAPTPAIAGYDQDEFARRLYYDRPIEASLEALKAARRTTAEILERLTDAEWAREGTHTEVGRYTVETWLEIYAEHAHEHARQIAVARALARVGPRCETCRVDTVGRRRSSIHQKPFADAREFPDGDLPRSRDGAGRRPALDLFAQLGRAGEDVEWQLLVLVFVRRIAPAKALRIGGAKGATATPRRFRRPETSSRSST